PSLRPLTPASAAPAIVNLGSAFRKSSVSAAAWLPSRSRSTGPSPSDAAVRLASQACRCSGASARAWSSRRDSPAHSSPENFMRVEATAQESIVSCLHNVFPRQKRTLLHWLGELRLHCASLHGRAQQKPRLLPIAPDRALGHAEDGGYL